MSPVLILCAGLATVMLLILAFRINAFVALYVSATVVSLLSPGDLGDKASRVAVAFGAATGRIGIVIALAAIIATCMMESGAADRIVRAFSRLFGERRGPLVLMGSGFTLGIPVYFDTVFYLLVPLARSFYRRTGRHYLKSLLAIAAGGVATHTMIPPTPGPLATANVLRIDLGMMILVGTVISIAAAAAGMTYAGFIDRRMPVTPRPPDGDEGPVSPPDDLLDGRQGPSLLLSLLPVLLPVLLIAARTITGEVAQASQDRAAWGGTVALANLLGDPNLALVLSLAIALFLLRQQRGTSLVQLGALMERSLSSAGVIILITAAGAAFGEMLKLAQISESMQTLMDGRARGGLSLLFIGFGTSALLRFAQGSTTAAMIVTSAIMAAMIGEQPLSFHPVYLATAIGGGGMVLSWMNDSGFWIFTRMSGLTEREGLKSWSALLTVMGVATFLASLLGATLVPLV